MSWRVAGALVAILGCTAKSRPAHEEIAGSASCRQCHEKFYGLWSTSFHGLSMQPWAATVAAALTPPASPVVIGDRRYRVEIAPERGTVVEMAAGGERRYAIAQALGGKNVFYFLTPLEKGFLQTLPVAFDVRRKEWFDVAQSSVRHAPGFSAQPLDWRDREYTFNSSCHSCHVSQLATNYDAASDSYRTTWAEPGINCETCHGPAAVHVRSFSSAAKGAARPATLELIRTKTMTHEQRNDLCAPCHARMTPLTSAFTPGDRYFDHFDLETLESADFHPDGRSLGETYTFTSWRLSRCAQAGGIDCVTCHTSSGRYRFRKAEDADKACLPCHTDKVEDAAAHTHHRAGTEGSRCISCHMPTTEFARMRQTDHSMRPPSPGATTAFGSPNACNLCHGDRDAQWASATLRKWRADGHEKATVTEGRLVQAARQRDWSRLDALLAYLRQEDRQEVVAASLVRLLRDCRDPRVPPALVSVLRADPSPLVRGAAAETLGMLAPPAALVPLVEATADAYRLVRIRAARALAAIPRDRIEPSRREALDRATAELEASFRVRADDPWTLSNAGTWRMDRGDLDGAASSLHDAVRLGPDHVPGWVNLSMVQAARGDLAGAEVSLRKALAIDPANAAANLNLGLLLGETNRPGEAEQALRAAVAADGELAVARYNLCVLLLRDRPHEAKPHCAAASRLRPDDARYAAALQIAVRRARP